MEKNIIGIALSMVALYIILGWAFMAYDDYMHENNPDWEE